MNLVVVSFLICTHDPTEEKDDATKDAFYAELDRAYERCPSHDIKILLGDFNAKVGREASLVPPSGDLVYMRPRVRNKVVRSTGFRHLDIHSASWLSADRLTRNQIDHVVIDARHASNILDVRSFRGPNIDSDHYLVAAKIRTRLCVAKIARRSVLRRLDIGKLQSQQAKNAFATHVSGLLSRAPSIPEDISDMWALISHSLRASAEVLGFQRSVTRNPWYDQKCHDATAAKDAAYRRTLQAGATRAIVDVYRSRRRDEKRLFRRKKKEQERRGLPIPSHIEVKDAIQRLKNNKSAGANGLPAELFKAAGDMLVGSMHQPISKIWLTESMPEDWNLSMICPILKKGDATVRT
ncbi:uncharacterized protein [Drosophila bipectinata]|uniref:uncharacterized protein n=1 Tax=Drosophila bipectinata TaxID=42026 RepID=UPI0038B3AC77